VASALGGEADRKGKNLLGVFPFNRGAQEAHPHHAEHAEHHHAHHEEEQNARSLSAGFNVPARSQRQGEHV
jgi:hypothetical protein